MSLPKKITEVNIVHSINQKIKLRQNVERSIETLCGGHQMRQLAGKIVTVSKVGSGKVRIVDPNNNGIQWWFLISDTTPVDIEPINISQVIFDPNNLCI